MKLLEEGLYQFFVQSGPLASVNDGPLSDANVFLMQTPENAPSPSMTFKKISSVDDDTLDGPSGFVTRRYQFDFTAHDTTGPNSGAVAALQLQDAVRAAFNGATGYLPNGLRVFNVMLSLETDHFDAQAQKYTAVTDYIVQFSQVN